MLQQKDIHNFIASMSTTRSIFFFLIIFFIFHLSLDTSTTNAAWVQSGFFYAGNELPVPILNSALYTHLVFAFAYINSSSYELYLLPSDQTYAASFTEIVRQKNPSVKTILSIWAGKMHLSNFFSMVNRYSNRKSFIKTSIKAAREYGFSGLDLCGVTPDTGSNMTKMEAFLDEWRAAINSEADSSGAPRLILTMGAYYSPERGEAMVYPVESIVRTFDWIHLMSYDYYLPEKDNFTGAHAALYDPFSKLNTDFGIKEWIRKGFPANKMTIGLPFHGYAWTLVNPKDDTIGSPAKGLATDFGVKQNGSVNYRAIKQLISSSGATPVFNSSYVVNYFISGTSWIGYDDVEAIKIKVSYAKEKGLLGYTVFQVPNDDTNWSLSRAAQGTEDSALRKRSNKLAILLPTCTLAVFLLCIAIYCVKRKRKSNQTSVDPNLQMFSFAQMQAATDNFSSRNKLGEGGFGPVYKGKLPNGQEIAVKRLSKSSKQGMEEFQNEVTLTVKLQHVNLLRIQGFCTERDEKMLVYDYMPNKSLDFYLFARRLQLDWEKRVQIIEGVTQGLLYLQEYSAFTVIHRDLKASNILLDNEMKPKISDFGIAKIFQKEDDQANTGRIVGTYGCVPPEYVKGGIYSRKYDIYSFGVLLLQIISGKKNACIYGKDNNLNLLEYAYEKWKNGSGMEFIDPSLVDNEDEESSKMMKCLQVALLCVQEKWENRPSMLDIDLMLKNETHTQSLPAPTMPAFSRKDDHEEQGGNSHGQEDCCSINFATTSQLLPR